MTIGTTATPKFFGDYGIYGKDTEAPRVRYLTRMQPGGIKEDEMYYCEKCKRFVEGSTWESQAPNHKFTRTEEPSNNPFYREVRCEMCGSDNLTEANECECCGEPTVETYCEGCMEEAPWVVNHLLKRNTIGDTRDSKRR